MRFPHNNLDGNGLKPPLTREEKRRARLLKRRKQRDRDAWRDSKHHSITPEIIGEFARLWGVDEAIDPEKIAAALAREHGIFANARTAAELEDNAPQTVVGIGRYKKRGYVLVYNEAKHGLGFPGGRVRYGQSPEARLVLETAEEANLVCKVTSPPVSEHFVGEEEHLFTAFEVEYTGGRPIARPTEDEPITAIVFVDEKTLLNACRTSALLAVKGLSEPVGILASHRKVFLEHASKRREGERKEAASV